MAAGAFFTGITSGGSSNRVTSGGGSQPKGSTAVATEPDPAGMGRDGRVGPYGSPTNPKRDVPYTPASSWVGPGTPVPQQTAATNLVTGLFGPQQQILNDTLARQMEQVGLVNADVDYQTAALKRDNALAQQLLGIDREGLGLDAGLVKGKLGNLGKLRAILGQQRGIAGETKTLTDEEARDMAGRKTFDLRSDLTARGAFNTVANERGTGRIQRDLDYQLRGNDIQYRNTLLGLDEKGISYDNQQADLQHKLSTIGLDSRRLDISEQQLENSLADGLHNIGMGGMVSINGLLDAMAGTNQQQAALATEILNAIITYSGLPPEVIAQIQGAIGATTPKQPPTAYSGGQVGGKRYQ